MTSLSIVMPCYNRAHDLDRILKAYDRQDVDDTFEIIAIDDASSDTTFELLTACKPSRYTLRAERQQTNQGPAAARNRGIELAQSPLIAFVGDDILPAPDFVRRHLEAHRKYPRPEVAILGKVVWPNDMPVNTLMQHIDGIGAQQFSYHYLQHGHEYDFRQFYTANISMKASLLNRLDHRFSTDFPFAAFEDAELAYRLSKQGLQIIYHDQPIGYHYHYHTIWTFSKRQYRAGMMACKVAEKHPELAAFLRVKKTRQLRVLGLIYRLSQRDLKALAETAEWLEQQVLFMTSFFEWTPHQLLDELYLKILEYYWRKGLIAGVFSDTVQKKIITYAYTVYYLGDFLKDYIPRACQHDLPLPFGELEQFEAKINGVEPSLLRVLNKFWKSQGHRLAKTWLYPDQLPTKSSGISSQ